MAVFLVAASGLGLGLVAPVVAVAPASAATALVAPSPAQILVRTNGTRTTKSDGYTGYEENLFGFQAITATIKVPTLNCANGNTWNTDARILAVMDTQTTGNGSVEHGGGVQIGCTVTGTPTYASVLCDSSLSLSATFSSGCEVLPDETEPGDLVDVTVDASGGCNDICSSVTSAVSDLNQTWTETVTSAAVSDFDVFFGLAGLPPLVNFGKVTMTGVTANGEGFAGQKYNFIDLGGHTLARSSALTGGRTSFSVTWVRAQ